MAEKEGNSPCSPLSEWVEGNAVCYLYHYMSWPHMKTAIYSILIITEGSNSVIISLFFYFFSIANKLDFIHFRYPLDFIHFRYPTGGQRPTLIHSLPPSPIFYSTHSPHINTCIPYLPNKSALQPLSRPALVCGWVSPGTEIAASGLQRVICVIGTNPHAL